MAQIAEDGARREYEALRPKVEKLEAQVRAITDHVSKKEWELFPETAIPTIEQADLAERVRRVLQPKEDTQVLSLTHRNEELREALENIKKALPKTSSEATPDTSDTQATPTTLAKRVKDLVRVRDEKAREVKILLKQAETANTELTAKAKTLEAAQQEAKELQNELQRMIEERDITRQTLSDAAETVKTFEDSHKTEYQPDTSDDLPTRLGKAVHHAETRAEETRTELTRLQQEFHQHKTEFEQVTTELDHAVPDDTTDPSAPKKTSLEKVQELSRAKSEQEQEVARLTQKVSNLEEANQLAATGGDDSGQLKTEFAGVKRQLSEAESELETIRTSLGAVKQGLTQWEESQDITPDNEDDIAGRVTTLITTLDEHEGEMTILRGHMDKLQSTREHMQVIVKSPMRLHPADMAAGLPDGSRAMTSW